MEFVPRKKEVMKHDCEGNSGCFQGEDVQERRRVSERNDEPARGPRESAPAGPHHGGLLRHAHAPAADWQHQRAGSAHDRHQAVGKEDDFRD